MRPRKKKNERKADLQLNAVLNNLFLLFDNLILFRVIRLGSLNAGGHGRVLRANTVSARGQVFREFSFYSLSLSLMLLTYTYTRTQQSPSRLPMQ